MTPPLTSPQARPTLTPEDILTVEEAASLLKLPPSTISDLCRQGRMPDALEALAVVADLLAAISDGRVTVAYRDGEAATYTGTERAALATLAKIASEGK